MSYKKRTNRLFVVLLISFLLPHIQIVDQVQAADPFFTLVAKSLMSIQPPYPPVYMYLDVFELIKTQLQKIGINLDVIYVEWEEYVTDIYASRDFDLLFLPLAGGGNDPNEFAQIYAENSSLNLSGYDETMDWNETLAMGENEWFIQQGATFLPPFSEERIQHYWQWEQYLLDEILPIIPFFGLDWSTASWAELSGYDISDGILQSWGKMQWTQQLPNQSSTSELVITNIGWSDGSWKTDIPMNPLVAVSYQNMPAISRAVMDPLVWIDSDKSFWPHLATGWEHMNDTHLRIYLQERVKWQNDSEDLFPDEYFDAEDVFFTFYCWKHLNRETEGSSYSWIKDMKIIDQYTIDIFIDGDPLTSENERFIDYLPRLNQLIVPEHYLNQTQLANGVTPDVSHPSWDLFSQHCFGTGILEYDGVELANSTMPYDEIRLSLFNDCWRMNTSLLADPNLDWAERFGISWSLNKLRVKVGVFEDAFKEFEQGRIDIINSNFVENLTSLAQSPLFVVQRDATDTMFSFYINMRENREWTGDRELCPNDPTMSIGLAIRKAIAYAFDREAINNFVYSNERPITNWPLYPSMGIWLNPDIITYNHDLPLAKEYMEKAGFSYSLKASNNNIVISFCLILSVAITIILRKRR